MRFVAISLVLLSAAHGPPRGALNPSHHRHTAVPSNWSPGGHDGSTRGDVVRSLGSQQAEFAGEHGPLNRVDFGNGSQLGLGFVQGHKPGLKFKLPF